MAARSCFFSLDGVQCIAVKERNTNLRSRLGKLSGLDEDFERGLTR